MSLNQKVDNKNTWKVVLVSYDTKLLDVVIGKIVDTAKSALVDTSVHALPNSNYLVKIPTSPFIYKTAGEHYVLKTSKRLIKLYFKKDQSIDIFRNVVIPAGIEITIKPDKG